VRTGILIAPVGVETQNLIVIKKTAGGGITTRSVLPVSFVPMITTREGATIMVHNGREILEKRAMQEGLAFSATRYSMAGFLVENRA
jgi:hypothetical protein